MAGTKGNTKAMGACIRKQGERNAEEKADEKTRSSLTIKLDRWYQELIEKTVETSPDHALKFAAIVSYPEPIVLAVFPLDFVPDPKGVKDIITALHQNDTSGIAEHGCYLGEGCPKGIPGKLDAGKAIYGTDGGEGGTDAFVAERSVLIGCYLARPAASTRLLRKTAQYMADQHK